MKETLQLPDTIEACHAMIIELMHRIAQLERRVFGSSLKDRSVKYDEPSLFDDLDQEAQLATAEALDKASKAVDAEAQKRRQEAKQARKANRPTKYNTYGLPHGSFI